MRTKSLLSLIMLMLCALAGVQAQTIQRGNKFFDGQYLYVVELRQNGNYCLNGMDITGHQKIIVLRKTGAAAGEYEMVQASPNQKAPFGCLFGCKVQYIREDGMNFLAFYPEEHNIGQTMVLTPDNITDCTAQQRFAEDETDPMEMVSSWLMNQHYLKDIHPEVLQGMINKLNAKKKKSVIERTNQQVMAYAQAIGLFGQDLEGEETEPTEGAPLSDGTANEYTVTKESELLSALGSNRTINIADGTTLNLSKVLEVQDYFVVYNRLWCDDYYPERQNASEFIVSCSRFDGRQLDLIGLHDLTIRGGNNCTIVVEPRYANVLNFYNCRNIRIENLTIGHTQEGYCEGGVIYCENCEAVNISNCDLYGCGTYGLEAHNTHGIVMEKSIIRDCSYGIMELHSSQFCSFLECDFMRCREFSLVTIDAGCRNTRFVNCRFAQNVGPLFSLNSTINVESCEIHHPKGMDLGNVDSSFFNYVNDRTRWFRDDKPLPRREIGPSKQ